LIIKPKSGVDVIGSSFSKGSSGIYTYEEILDPGDTVRTIEIQLEGMDTGKFFVESEVYFSCENDESVHSSYETLELNVENHGETQTYSQQESYSNTDESNDIPSAPGFSLVHGLIACSLVFILKIGKSKSP
jgi:hypothetical protein